MTKPRASLTNELSLEGTKVKKSVRYLLLSIMALLMHTNLLAQDAHFSQYYTFAQNLNPALTANYEGSYRVALMHRNQWASFS